MQTSENHRLSVLTGALVLVSALIVTIASAYLTLDWVQLLPGLQATNAGQREVAAVSIGRSEHPITDVNGSEMQGEGSSPQSAMPVGEVAPQTVSPISAQPNFTLPVCNVTACSASYRTFTASDCTYQPSQGERRLCTKGKRMSQTGLTSNASADQRSRYRCNIDRCTASYRSFDPSDCSYKPSAGPRRLCTK